MDKHRDIVCVTISDELIKMIKRKKQVCDTLGYIYEINDMECLIKNVNQSVEMMEKIHVIVDSFIAYMLETFQQLNKAIYQLSLRASMRAIQFYADEIQKILETEAQCIKRENLRRDNKALYKRNTMLQNRQYSIQIKLARKQTIKANRPQIVRRLP